VAEFGDGARLGPAVAAAPANARDVIVGRDAAAGARVAARVGQRRRLARLDARDPEAEPDLAERAPAGHEHPGRLDRGADGAEGSEVEHDPHDVPHHEVAGLVDDGRVVPVAVPVGLACAGRRVAEEAEHESRRRQAHAPYDTAGPRRAQPPPRAARLPLGRRARRAPLALVLPSLPVRLFGSGLGVGQREERELIAAVRLAVGRAAREGLLDRSAHPLMEHHRRRDLAHPGIRPVERRERAGPGARRARRLGRRLGDPPVQGLKGPQGVPVGGASPSLRERVAGLLGGPSRRRVAVLCETRQPVAAAVNAGRF